MRGPSRLVLKLLAVTAAAWPGGCTPPPTTQPGTYKTIAPDLRRDINLAAHLDRLGVEMLEHNQLPQAEAKFKEALTADMFYGPAHSNLGTVYYKQGKLYLAAWEYQYAAKLMPEKAAPINNQGMVQERAGRLDEAAKLYERAAKLDAESAQIAANLARTYIRMDRRDHATTLALQKVVARDSRPEWVSWAQRELATIGRRADRTTTAPASALAALAPIPGPASAHKPAPSPKLAPTSMPAPASIPAIALRPAPTLDPAPRPAPASRPGYPSDAPLVLQVIPALEPATAIRPTSR